MSAAESQRIMKRHSGGLSDTRIAFNFEDVQERCESYKASVKEQCRQMVLEADNEAAQIRAQAEKQGHSEGYRNGLRQAEEEIERKSQQRADQLVEQRLSTVLPAVTELLNDLVYARSQFQADWEAELVALSVAIASRIVKGRLERQPEAMLGLVKETVQLAVGRSSVELRLNPHDLEALGERVQATVKESARGMEVRLVADKEVSPGGTIVITDHGQIDARIETILDRISGELLDGIQ